MNRMNKGIIIIAFLIFGNFAIGQNKDTDDYIEFDDRKNIVHGVYVGLSVNYFDIWSEATVVTSLKMAYVANRKLEVGVSFNGFYSRHPNTSDHFQSDEVVLYGGYLGFHIEPILFGTKFISVSFPVLVGGGGVGVAEPNEDNVYTVPDSDGEYLDPFFIVEPGVSVQYNISRFVQIETGLKYRFTSMVEIPAFEKDNINGFSIGVGLKVGIFNMGRKKKITPGF